MYILEPLFAFETAFEFKIKYTGNILTMIVLEEPWSTVIVT